MEVHAGDVYASNAFRVIVNKLMMMEIIQN